MTPEPAPGVPAPTPTADQQQLLQAMVEGISTGIIVSNDTVVIYANQEFGRLLGYGEHESLAGALLTDLVADSHQVLALQRRKAVAAGRRIPTGWIKFRGKGGVLVQMMPNLSRVLWNGQPHFIAAIQRASDQDLLDIQVRKTRGRYERLLVQELEKRQTDIALELHDSLGSELAGMSLMLGSIKASRADDAALQARLDQVLNQLQTAVDITRGMARGLMPVDPHEGGFCRAMERLAHDWTLLKGVPCELSMDGDFNHVAADTGTHLYRIAQEAIANALRHGKADRIRIALARSGAELLLDIADNGSGFDPALAGAPNQEGMGLHSMMARARAVGGRIAFSRAHPQGCRIRVFWPA